MRGELLRLRAALDEVKFGIVLLDAELRAQFINRAYRQMWRVPDVEADSHPSFVALMHHGRDTRAYAIPEAELDGYVAERVAHVRSGSAAPRDIRLASGEVIRFQCSVLPDGGRMLSYTDVTDFVRHADELAVLRAALDNVDEGIILLDSQLNAQFMNRAVRRLWGVSDTQASQKPPYAELVNDSRITKAYDVPPDQLDAYISRRIACVKAGDPEPADLRVHDGRRVRANCSVLPDGGRMLTYTDVTDLVRTAETLERFATTDGMTGLYNRRHFLVLADAEWSRFQRYHRPFSLLVFDIDHFKSINDRFGHPVGDQAIAHFAALCCRTTRTTDIAARTGGDEFVMLLPETGRSQAEIVAERLRQLVLNNPLCVDGTVIPLTVSIGMAQATLSQSGIDALMQQADQALYRAKAAGRNRIACATGGPADDYTAAAE